MKQIPLKEIMIQKVITVKIDEPFSHVEKKFRENKIRHLPVVDEQNKLVGMITQNDLYRVAKPRITEDGAFYDEEFLDSIILKHVMSRDPVALKPFDTVQHAVDIMAEHKFGCIPIVTGEGLLAGIVSQIDILKFISKWFRSDA